MNNKTSPVFTGAATALITPFKDGKVDYPSLEKIIEFQIAGGINGLVICGTTGEPATLDDEEHRRVLDFCINCIAGRVPVIAGTGSNSTDYAIELTKFAKSAGADAALLVTPYYNKCSQAGIVKHFNMVADSADIPCILYNVPSRTGFCISADSYKQLAKHPNIVAVKEASGMIPLILQVLYECAGELDLYIGDDHLIVPVMSMGAKGVISVLSNVIPGETAKMARLCLEGNTREAARIQLGYQRLINGLFTQVNPIPVKTAMAQMGYCENEFRMPLCPMDESENARLRALLADYGLI